MMDMQTLADRVAQHYRQEKERLNGPYLNWQQQLVAWSENFIEEAAKRPEEWDEEVLKVFLSPQNWVTSAKPHYPDPALLRKEFPAIATVLREIAAHSDLCPELYQEMEDTIKDIAGPGYEMAARKFIVSVQPGLFTTIISTERLQACYELLLTQISDPGAELPPQRSCRDFHAANHALYLWSRRLASMNPGIRQVTGTDNVATLAQTILNEFRYWFPAAASAVAARTAPSSRRDPYEPMRGLLRRCHNLILSGAPGTGKTYIARHKLARVMLDQYCRAHPEGPDTPARSAKHIAFVQLHPAYDYGDFVVGVEADAESGHLMRRRGVFTAFCAEAVASLLSGDDCPYFFIIDEINRGDLSRILGELLFSIDPDCRMSATAIRGGLTAQAIPVRTRYHGLLTQQQRSGDPFAQGFYVPENVYLIGTMNGLDRGADALDFATRRRFAFHELEADRYTEMIDRLQDTTSLTAAQTARLKGHMRALNACISSVEGLGRRYHVGGAYFALVRNFLPSGHEVSDSGLTQAVELLWEHHLRGLMLACLHSCGGDEAQLQRLREACLGPAAEA